MVVENGAVRSRTMEEEVASSSPSKRRKVNSQPVSSPKNSVSVSTAATVDSPPSTATSISSDLNNSTSTVKSSSKPLDLNENAEDLETDLSTFTVSHFRETKPSSKPCGDLGEMESSPVKKKHSSPLLEMPPAEEVEEFFAEVEQHHREEQKRFTEKYNFDIVKGEPLEGRYEWVKIK